MDNAQNNIPETSQIPTLPHLLYTAPPFFNQIPPSNDPEQSKNIDSINDVSAQINQENNNEEHKKRKRATKKNPTFVILNVLSVINHIYPILPYILTVNKNIIRIIILVEIAEDQKKTRVKWPQIKICTIPKPLNFSKKKKEREKLLLKK
jgi:hypothetical protein